MAQPPYRLDAPRRDVVLAAVQGVCRHRVWRLAACHVRSNHVHVVVSGDLKPEKAMNDFKSYSSRALNDAGFDTPSRRRWTRHGSTIHLFEADAASDAVGYTGHAQGEPMAVFVADPPYPWEE